MASGPCAGFFPCASPSQGRVPPGLRQDLRWCPYRSDRVLGAEGSTWESLFANVAENFTAWQTAGQNEPWPDDDEDDPDEDNEDSRMGMSGSPL